MKFFEEESQAAFIRRVYEETPPVLQTYFALELNWLRDAVAGIDSVVEIGCGTGRASKAIPDFVRYTGIDIGLSFVKEAKLATPQRNWICGNACGLPFEDGSIPCLFCIQNTIGNMEGIEDRVLAEMRRVIHPQGNIILSAYSDDSFEIRKIWYDRLIDSRIFGKVWIDPQNPRIARSDTGWSSRCFSENELRGMLNQAGFEVRVRKMNSLLFFCEAVPQK